jgi:hypothetical protein
MLRDTYVFVVCDNFSFDSFFFAEWTMIMQELEIVWYEWAKQIYLINNSYFKISVITDCILVKIIPF